MKDYWTCPHCGANLDYGEKCDCDRRNKEVVLNEYDIEENSYPEL